MKFSGITPMLRTKDLEGSVEFYTRLLGFECGALSEDWGWASLSRDGVTIMLAPRVELPGPKPHPASVALTAAHATRSAGARLTAPAPPPGRPAPSPASAR